MKKNFFKQKMADQFNLKLFETSAKDSTNVNELFTEIAAEIMKKNQI